MVSKWFRGLSVGCLSVQQSSCFPEEGNPKEWGEVVIPFVIWPQKPHTVTQPEGWKVGAMWVQLL